MSVEPSPSDEPGTQAKSRRRLLIIVVAAALVILAGIAVAVSSLATRPGQENAPTASATASHPSDPVSTAPANSDEPASPAVQSSPAAQSSPASPTSPASPKAVSPQEAELLDEANTVCEMRLIDKHPTAVIEPGTKSTAKATAGSFETAGSYTDEAAGNSAPQQFKCSSVSSGGSWTVELEQG